MDVLINGTQRVTLTQRDFKGQGGEGSVYLRQGTAFKIYADPSGVLAVGKIRELSVLTDPAIIKPEQPLLDANGTLIGYTMRAVEDAVTLCQTFTKAFRDRFDLTPDRVGELVRQLQTRVKHVHERGILIVDLNEMNFLVSDDLTTLYAIDVDSYQTPSYPATAIMDSIRDRHRTVLSAETDWFSFAVISFQMFIGLHPYRGKHPIYPTMDERMRANISALNPSVSLPSVCPPLSVIPQAYRDWYEAVLERGQRVPPPDVPIPSFTLAPAASLPVLLSGILEFDRIGAFEGAILDAVGEAILTTSGVYIGHRKMWDAPAGAVVHLVVAPKGTVLAAWREKGMLQLVEVRRGQSVPIQARADALMSVEGRLYVRQGGSLMEVTFVETPARTFAQAAPVGTVLEKATALFPGVALQNLLGATYASLLPQSGVCQQVRLPELDGARVVEAGFQGGVLIVVAERGGTFDRLVYRFTPDYRSYDLRRETDVATYEVNFVTLPTGVSLLRVETEDGPTLDLFATKKDSTTRKLITDPALKGDCRLLRSGTQARLAKRNILYDMRMGK